MKKRYRNCVCCWRIGGAFELSDCTFGETVGKGLQEVLQILFLVSRIIANPPQISYFLSNF